MKDQDLQNTVKQLNKRLAVKDDPHADIGDLSDLDNLSEETVGERVQSRINKINEQFIDDEDDSDSVNVVSNVTTVNEVAKKRTSTSNKRKVGRPSDKKRGIKYTRLTVSIPDATLNEMKIALLTRFKGVHDTQNNFVDAAIKHYLETWDRE
ncbi:MAG: hypothetical protein ACPGXL_08795 [Chitinophagales bacterium]